MPKRKSPGVKFELTEHRWVAKARKPQREIFKGFFPTRKLAWSFAENDLQLSPYLSRDRLRKLRKSGEPFYGYSVTPVRKNKSR
ncbi:hypothetical protein KW796_02805 [Candidatus Parcubacteria bacterium]|nr:hypothetical protein [Candidatus Parcubacteria bacterium]